MNQQEQIEMILQEASAYGLRQEVLETAERLIDEEGYQKMDAFEEAFNEWIK